MQELYCTKKQEENKLWSKFTQWQPSWIWAFQVSGPPQLLCVSLMIVYACQDHILESLKTSFFVMILDSKYSKMTPKFVKQKSHWLHSSIKFANPVLYVRRTYSTVCRCTVYVVNSALGITCIAKSLKSNVTAFISGKALTGKESKLFENGRLQSV